MTAQLENSARIDGLLPRSVLRGQNISVTFRRAGSTEVQALNDCSVDVNVGETVALVGETGSGKTTLAMALMGALAYLPEAQVNGTIHIVGQDTASLKPRALSALRAKSVGVIFQEPGGSLHPLRRIGSQMVEILRLIRGLPKDAAARRSLELLRSAGLPDPAWQMSARIGQLSGGMQQRAAIALGLACDPQVIVADEPTTALDVSVQAQILELLSEKVTSQSIGMLVVTHDLGVVAGLADRIYVMYAGRIVEQGDASDLLGAPSHPYTQQLVACSQLTTLSDAGRATASADVSGVAQSGHGCRFAGRCPYATDQCRAEEPKLEGSSGRKVACWHSDEIASRPAVAAVTTPVGAGPEDAPGGALPDVTVAVGEAASGPARPDSPLLVATDVSVEYRDSRFRGGTTASVVRGVSLELRAGEVIGIVGESGSGKSTLARALLGLAPMNHGDVAFHGESLRSMRDASQRRMRSKVQLMVQNSTSAFDPRMTVSQTLREILKVHGGTRGQQGRQEAGDLLAKVGLPRGFGSRLPRELSGGQRQRVSLARALATGPEILIADEPTASLDLLSRLQVLQLIRSLQRDAGLGVLFISHDIGAVALVSDQVAVMYLGRIVERGPVRSVLGQPRHPYTAALLAAVPDINAWRDRSGGFSSIPGEVPSVRAVPSGCAFHTRCPFAVERCRHDDPFEAGVGDNHVVACWRSEEIDLSSGPVTVSHGR